MKNSSTWPPTLPLPIRALFLATLFVAIGQAAAPVELREQVSFSGTHTQTFELVAGDTIEISVGIESPSRLPVNGRIAVEWVGPIADVGWRKILHALDPDTYLVYRAPQAGRYAISLTAVDDEEPVFNKPRWRETGIVSEVDSFPRHTPWPAGHVVPVRLAVQTVDFGRATRGTMVEVEPNNSLATAQFLPPFADDAAILHITGGADDIEYFDNGLYGDSGDDWFRIEYRGQEGRLLSANMMPTDPFVAARIRVYSADGREFTEGKHHNETAHEQVEEHRTAVVRSIQPGGIYFLRVEANSPGYDLEVRVRPPAPFTDPRDAVRLALYDHVAQVSAWLMNRPRGNSLDRRLRDTGSLYGSNCMSCHTQSGVWGPAVPITFGYGIENPLHYRHLINIMYESLRPTNVLKDAANNTSLPPHDLGDGPAGTRVAGHNVLTAELAIAPRKLHSRQQIRTANYVLQTRDPSGINAAGKGSNVGEGVVIHYASEILRKAWDKTGETRYLTGVEERATEMLELDPKFTDDIAHRILFFRRVLAQDYAARNGESATPTRPASEEPSAALTPRTNKLADEIRTQLQQDEKALRNSQREDGAWGFAPGKIDSTADPAPTALAIDALVALGADRNDPAVARGVQALLAMQHPYGLWNRSARTGFVTTSYVLHTLSRLFPDSRPKLTRGDLEPRPAESLHDTIARFRQLAHVAPWSAWSTEYPADQYIDLMQLGAVHSNPHVRYWSMLALGGSHARSAVPPLVNGLNDPVKMVREAARWGLRQTLLDDHGWVEVFAAYDQGGDLQREQLAAALIMRADTVMTGSTVDLHRLADVLDRMMSRDANPAVRAWATRAAWNWWVWNPPIRKPLNNAFVSLLQTPEPSALAQSAKRYQLQALLIANGNRASANYDNAYKELADLFQSMGDAMDASSTKQQISQRLTGVAATYYSASYGSNGTGQLGYATPNSSKTIGKAVSYVWNAAEQANDSKTIQLAIEGAANVIDEAVQQKLLHYSIKGPESLRAIASSSLSDPRAVLLPTSPEFVGPLIERIHNSAKTEEGRRQISRTTIRQLSQARWDMPTSEGRLREFYNLIIPKLDDPSSDVHWFLAEQLGSILAANPDFHTETLLAMVPQSVGSPLEETFWLPSAGWMMTFDTPIPEVGQGALVESRSELRTSALSRYLRNLSPDVDRRLRTLAVSLLYQPALNSHPDVVSAANRVDLGMFGRLLPTAFDAEIRQAAAEDKSEPKLELTPERLRNFNYFRNFVMPELDRINRADGNSCFTCHGGGKIPSMSLEAPDRRSKFLAPRDVWTNYRTLLERVNASNVEHSKVLRKPLNIQTGEEDGHQGGMRYKPGDRGHEIFTRWAQHAARIRTVSTQQPVSTQQRGANADAIRFRVHEIDRPGGNNFGQTSAVDVDRDGDLDFISGQQFGTLYWFENQAVDKWIRHLIGERVRTDVGGVAFDVNGDGWVDQVSGGTWFRNPGDSRIAQRWDRFENGATATHDNLAIDIDRDGKLDLVSILDKAGVFWYRIPNDPTQHWIEHKILGVTNPQCHGGIAVGDIDGDGDIDVSRVDRWMENSDGKGEVWIERRTFDFGKVGPWGIQTRARLVDIDRDGDLDLIQAEGDVLDGRIAWFENRNGNGTDWERHMIKSPGHNQDFHSICVADFDNDGDQDIFSGGGPLTKGEHLWFVWENQDGKGQLWREQVIQRGKETHESVCGDIDGDGDIDILTKPWRGDLHLCVENLLVTRQGR